MYWRDVQKKGFTRRLNWAYLKSLNTDDAICKDGEMIIQSIWASALAALSFYTLIPPDKLFLAPHTPDTFPCRAAVTCAAPNTRWHPGRDASWHALFNLYCPFWQISPDCFDEWRLDCSGVDLTVPTCFLRPVIYVFPYDLIPHSKSQTGMMVCPETRPFNFIATFLQLHQQFFLPPANENRGRSLFITLHKARWKEKVKYSLAAVFFWRVLACWLDCRWIRKAISSFTNRFAQWFSVFKETFHFDGMPKQKGSFTFQSLENICCTDIDNRWRRLTLSK